MASIRYRTKTNNSYNSIYLRFKDSSTFDIELSTGIKVPKRKFSNSLQRINPTDLVDYKTLNTKLRELSNYILNQYSVHSVDGLIINNKWLKFNVNTFLNNTAKDNSVNEKIYLMDFLKSFIKDAEIRLCSRNNPIKLRTIKHYKTTQNKIEAFQNHIGVKLKLTHINLNFHQNFIEYLEIKQHLNPNTIGGYVDVLKQACKKAELKGYKIHPAYKSSDFYTPYNKTIDTYLSLEEINKIYNHTFHYDYLDNARDWLIISVWTGLRVSDLLSLNTSNLDGDFIKKDTLKTDFPVIIPIHKQVKSILEKRKGKFPRKISDQKYNSYIKEVCKHAGIIQIIKGSKLCPVEVKIYKKKETIYRKIRGKYPKYKLISSHIGRRSFATNHYGKLDTLTLMKITGHTTEKQFLDYIKITPIEYALKLKSYWKKLNLDEFVNS